MTITTSDIKLLASARMTDDADGGGAMTGTALQDGAENNVFPDIGSMIDRARGSLQFRKVFAAVLSLSTETLLGAHVILDDLPDDAAVGAVLIGSSSAAPTLDGLVTALNLAGESYGFHGASATTAITASGSATVALAATRTALIPKVTLSSAVAGNLEGSGAQPTVAAWAPSDGAAVAQVMLPSQTMRFAAVDGQLVYALQLPAGTVPGSERLTVPAWTVPSGGGALREINYTIGAGSMSDDLTLGYSGPGIPTYATVARSTGLLTVILQTALPTGSTLVVTYAAGGTTTPLPGTALAASGLITAGIANVAVDAGLELGGATFDVGTSNFVLLGGVIRSGGNVRGAATAAGVITLAGINGLSITNWHGVQTNPLYGVPRVDAVLPTSLDAATLVITGTTTAGTNFTATASTTGVFATAQVTGTYLAATGALALVFASSTRLRSLTYAATQQQPQTAFADIQGINSAVFAADGTVPIIVPGRVGVLRHTATVAAATYAAGATVNVGRTNLSDVRVINAAGAGITAGWSVNLTTGIVTLASVAVPVTIRHSLEHVAMILSVPNAGAVVLSRAVTRDFPVGSVLSSALLLGDLQAKAGAGFSQESWTGAWSDARVGSAIVAQYQQIAHPVLVNNIGAVTERWACIFTTSTAYRLVGETLGQIATGDVNTDLVPINPATGAAYFTLAATGWGSGWAAGNVLRLNTSGANAPVWVARVVLPSAPNATPDSLTIAIRGDIDA